MVFDVEIIFEWFSKISVFIVKLLGFFLEPVKRVDFFGNEVDDNKNRE